MKPFNKLTLRGTHFQRPRMAALLLCTLGALGQAQAGISTGVADPVTGQSWIRATTLQEGLDAGFVPASTADFSAYLQHGGFGGPDANQEFWTRTSAAALMGFQADAYVSSSMPYEYSNPSVALGWLNGNTSTLGAILFTTGRQMGACPGSYSYGCYSAIYVNEAAYGPLGEFLAGQHDRYSYATNGDWKSALSKVAQGDGTYKAGYFMLRAVPEPSTWSLMGLGLVALAWGTRRAGRSAA
jgi:PEP-CTERM motif